MANIFEEYAFKPSKQAKTASTLPKQPERIQTLPTASIMGIEVEPVRAFGGGVSFPPKVSTFESMTIKYSVSSSIGDVVYEYSEKMLDEHSNERSTWNRNEVHEMIRVMRQVLQTDGALVCWDGDSLKRIQSVLSACEASFDCIVQLKECILTRSTPLVEVCPVSNAAKLFGLDCDDDMARNKLNITVKCFAKGRLNGWWA